MSATRFSCPHCATSVLLPSDNTTRFACPQCGAGFGVVLASASAESLTGPAPTADPVADVPEAEAVAEEPEVAAVPVPMPVVVLPQPVPVRVPPEPAGRADEEDERAPKRRRRRDEDEDEEDRRPRRRAAARREPGQRRADSGGKVAVFVCVGALLLIGVAVGGYFAFRDPPKEVAKSEPPAPPKPAPPKAPELTPEQMIKKVKASTVYVRTLYRGGLYSSGTGFFAGKPGFVVTNAHVIGYGPRELRVPEKVELVVDSGEAGERTIAAKVFGLDADFDLAVLRVDMPDLPAPLPFGKSESLVETQEVVIFGYPFGEQLGKNVSVNRTTVSSLRKANGSVETVQLAGGLNPGNSGGPVTNAKGQVIGVSVAKLRGTDTIGFAIPAEVADRFVDDMIACGGQVRLGYLAVLAPDPPAKLPGGPVVPPARPKGVGWAPLRLPPPKALALTPAKFAGDTAGVKLPSVADAACVGGGGRFVIFHLPDDKRLAILDVCEAKVVKTIPVPEKVLFAAGMNTVLVVDAEADTVERWSLTTFTKEASADLPVSPGLTAVAVAMGSASDGPLMVLALDFPRLGERFLFDITTGKEVRGSRTHDAVMGTRGGDVLRAGADGRTFTQSRPDGTAAVIAVTDTGYHEARLPASGVGVGAVLGGDGQTVYTSGSVAGRSGLSPGPAVAPVGPFLPAAHGPLVLARFTPRGTAKPVVAVHAGRDGKPLVQLPLLPALEAVFDRENVSRPDRHVFFLPAARALVVLLPDGDAVTLHKLDVDALLGKAGDYLFVSSAPPQAVTGRPFEYQLAVNSKAPATGFKLLAGPPDLAVSADGRVTWAVPPTFEKPAVVAVAITGADGKDRRHEFDLIPTLPPPE